MLCTLACKILEQHGDRRVKGAGGLSIRYTVARLGQHHHTLILHSRSPTIRQCLSASLAERQGSSAIRVQR